MALGTQGTPGVVGGAPGTPTPAPKGGGGKLAVLVAVLLLLALVAGLLMLRFGVFGGKSPVAEGGTPPAPVVEPPAPIVGGDLYDCAGHPCDATATGGGLPAEGFDGFDCNFKPCPKGGKKLVVVNKPPRPKAPKPKPKPAPTVATPTVPAPCPQAYIAPTHINLYDHQETIGGEWTTGTFVYAPGGTLAPTVIHKVTIVE
jgi:hypothetical protein